MPHCTMCTRCGPVIRVLVLVVALTACLSRTTRMRKMRARRALARCGARRRRRETSTPTIQISLRQESCPGVCAGPAPPQQRSRSAWAACGDSAQRALVSREHSTRTMNLPSATDCVVAVGPWRSCAPRRAACALAAAEVDRSLGLGRAVLSPSDRGAPCALTGSASAPLHRDQTARLQTAAVRFAHSTRRAWARPCSVHDVQTALVVSGPGRGNQARGARRAPCSAWRNGARRRTDVHGVWPVRRRGARQTQYTADVSTGL